MLVRNVQYIIQDIIPFMTLLFLILFGFAKRECFFDGTSARMPAKVVASCLGT